MIRPQGQRKIVNASQDGRSSDEASESEVASSETGNTESAQSDSAEDSEQDLEVEDVEDSPVQGQLLETNSNARPKRKRKREEEAIEDVYMERLARVEAREIAREKPEKAAKRQKVPDDETSHSDSSSNSSSESDGEVSETEEDLTRSPKTLEEQEDDDFEIPQHETLSNSHANAEREKSSRTVFLGNVSVSAISSKSDRKTLETHLRSFLPSLLTKDKDQRHKLESLRFRSTAYASAIPKRAAFAKKEYMEATSKSTNAYAVYTTAVAAREAAKRLNGTVVLDRHLRVDSVAHPAKTDHRRCVFVGNLGFVDDDSALQIARDEERGKQTKRPHKPSDVEEGLWREFGRAGTVESVRVVRDPKTRVGKGFAYVQFTVCIRRLLPGC